MLTIFYLIFFRDLKSNQSLPAALSSLAANVLPIAAVKGSSALHYGLTLPFLQSAGIGVFTSTPHGGILVCYLLAFSVRHVLTLFRKKPTFGNC